MTRTGHCYCGEVRYESTGQPMMKAQCHCRECQYITGGSPNVFMVVPSDGFRITQGQTKAFTRSDIPNPVTREFCPNCGTHLLTRAPGLPGGLVLKVGSLDDPSEFGKPDMAIFLCDRQSFHSVPEGLPAFDKFPG